MERLLRSPALERLEWVLDGFDDGPGGDGNGGDQSWGEDADVVLAPELAARIPAQNLVRTIRASARSYAPIVVVGVDVTDHTAKARLRDRDGKIHVLTCGVEPDPPHRLSSVWVSDLVPASLTPRLPMDFAGHDLDGVDHGMDGADHDGAPVAGKAALMVFSGLPGVGKSTLADAVGRVRQVPVFSVDWLLGALTPFGGRHLDDLLGIGAEQLTTLALRQLSLGQSAILDAPVEDLPSRARWASLARRAGADFKVVSCVCSDPVVHRSRVEGRVRGIPGWHEGGNWGNVSRRRAEFVPWDGDVLTVDTLLPFEDNLAEVLRYLDA
ncbi:AAA family ATPase [Actinopolymorpha pittospori]